MAHADETLQPVRWLGDAVELLDQTQLPHAYLRVAYRSVDGLASAIREMRVRGAPAIGVTAAYGYVLGAVTADRDLETALTYAFDTLLNARPTAVNLGWALRRMRNVYSEIADSSPTDIRSRLLAEAEAIHAESYRADVEISRFGADLLQGKRSLLTHCNTGPLATAGYGTALGVIRSAHAREPGISVLVDETRPFLQGARLTAWELQELGIPATLIADNMAGYMMQLGEVDAVIVGADRIASNGDVANKIGTYSLAVLARAHGVPFYVAAPTTTIDLDTPHGSHIPIEERDPREVLEFRGIMVAPRGVAARHPAFDVTPAALITAIITENGVATAPFELSLPAALTGAQAVA